MSSVRVRIAEFPDYAVSYAGEVGYAGRLEAALKYVRRAEVAINALEGNE